MPQDMLLDLVSVLLVTDGGQSSSRRRQLRASPCTLLRVVRGTVSSSQVPVEHCGREVQQYLVELGMLNDLLTS